jgi:hypothetical protein
MLLLAYAERDRESERRFFLQLLELTGVRCSEAMEPCVRDGQQVHIMQGQRPAAGAVTAIGGSAVGGKGTEKTFEGVFCGDESLHTKRHHDIDGRGESDIEGQRGDKTHDNNNAASAPGSTPSVGIYI